jgi:F0F1-type ATP synthase assembly protein I
MSNDSQNAVAVILAYFVSAVFVGVWVGLVINIIKFVSF